ncbi:Na+/H+ antiporter NhaC family protein [Echinimonas agarilytica]|uniref:Na+/H+ antiporter NhaC family protein n=1 Tax=Echinimonas agarilytica TaxID=1215918 RepID=A0AA42B903_9GAMM|nr:Na+/H+ antiporter NhaC family protein [Echinimonas agarilytica]MCM2680801.1 Na+/H+ antiporter NhaC family protein [Echinimonas agarilytica]
MTYADSALSLLPPLLALTAAVVTRKVLLSLGLGIALGVVLLGGGDPIVSGAVLAEKITDLVWDDGALNSWNFYIVGFLLLLGMLTSILSASGATEAFANWALTRINSARSGRLMTAILGIVIFIDDYFNSLAVGSISRPVADRLQISRAKLAYLLDSTAAPMCVLMPISSWGAYIIAVIGGILAAHNLTDMTAIHAFVALIPMNFYALFAIVLVLVVSIWPINLGSMKTAEIAARDPEVLRAAIARESLTGLEPMHNGRVQNLLLPIAILILATVSALLMTGVYALQMAGEPMTVLGALENTDVGLSLVMGGLVALLSALSMIQRQKAPQGLVFAALGHGIKSMMPAIYILAFAWTIGSVISSLETGTYLASFVGTTIDVKWLPLLLFGLSGVMAFATGTSWGTFGIMLPIAGDMAAATEISMMLPMLAAVLAGAVFGDHCSPISDTTILSSTGAGCDHIEHVRTQLPYAMLVAGISAIGYAVLGISGSVVAALAVCCLVFCLLVFGLIRNSRFG